LAANDAAEGLGRCAQLAMKDVIDTVFDMAVSTDGAYEDAELIGVKAPTEEQRAAGALLSQVATADAEVALAAKRYAHFFDREALAASSIAAKLEAWKQQGTAVVNNDPNVIPGVIG
jgi:hypothetical protein